MELQVAAGAPLRKVTYDSADTEKLSQDLGVIVRSLGSLPSRACRTSHSSVSKPNLPGQQFLIAILNCDKKTIFVINMRKVVSQLLPKIHSYFSV